MIKYIHDKIMLKRLYKKLPVLSPNQGFSLMELLLVVLIISLLFAVLVPKLITLRIESRHEIVRQSCTELASSVENWLQKTILAQDDQRSSATLADYVATLANREPPDSFTSPPKLTGQWVATVQRPNNWNVNRMRYDMDEQLVSVPGRWMGKKRNTPPESVVEKNIPGNSAIKNPFTGKNIFRPDNDPLFQKKPVPGAIAFTSVLGTDETLTYGFCFQGQDSTTLEWNRDSTFYGKQNLLSRQGIEHCTIFAEYR